MAEVIVIKASAFFLQPFLTGWICSNTIDSDSTVGFKIKIEKIPSNAASREIYVDNKHVASIERDWSKPSSISDYIMYFT